MAIGLQLRIAVGAAAVIIAGCAQQPVRATSGVPTPAAATAAAAPSAAAQAGAGGMTPELLGLARDDGYRPSVVNGNTVFCRREMPIGSSLPVRECVDVTRLRLEVLQEQQQRQQLNQHPPTIGLQPGK